LVLLLIIASCARKCALAANFAGYGPHHVLLEFHDSLLNGAGSGNIPDTAFVRD